MVSIQSDAGYLYPSRVTHMRMFPLRYRFFYRVFYLLLDIDRLAEAARGLRFFSYNRFNLLSFHDRDHGGHDGRPLRLWLENILHGQGIRLDGGRIRLLCLPRMLGHVFNPISIYYCEHRDGSLRAILAEVHNTFGERHSYLLSRDGQRMDYAMPHYKAKVFHVSPLIGMGGNYQFRFSPPEGHYRVLIRLFQQDGGREKLLLATALDGDRQYLSDRHLLAQLLRMPFMTMKVVAAIHWQAMKIWIQGAPFFRKPVPPAQEVT